MPQPNKTLPTIGRNPSAGRNAPHRQVLGQGEGVRRKGRPAPFLLLGMCEENKAAGTWIVPSAEGYTWRPITNISRSRTSLLGQLTAAGGSLYLLARAG